MPFKLTVVIPAIGLVVASGAAVAGSAPGKGDRLVQFQKAADMTDPADLKLVDFDLEISSSVILPVSINHVAPSQIDSWSPGATALSRAIQIQPASSAGVEAYGLGDFVENVALIPWETAAIVGGTLAVGIMDWNWGGSSFRFQNEGFFGEDTNSGGMDKLGHAYGSAIMADFFTERMSARGADRHAAALSGSLMSYGVMGLVEVFDGFTSEHGFSYEDVVMNTIGVTFSYLRNTVPGLEEKVDFRIEYLPSGYDGDFSPHSDYAGQKYILALKFSGFHQLAETPLRYFELHAGYFTEGFNAYEAKVRGIEESRHPYIGIGLNLEQIVFGDREEGESRFIQYSREAFQHVQVPYTYATYDKSAYHY